MSARRGRMEGCGKEKAEKRGRTEEGRGGKKKPQRRGGVPLFLRCCACGVPAGERCQRKRCRSRAESVPGAGKCGAEKGGSAGNVGLSFDFRLGRRMPLTEAAGNSLFQSAEAFAARSRGREKLSFVFAIGRCFSVVQSREKGRGILGSRQPPAWARRPRRRDT